MSFDLGALVTRMVVQGRAEFERDIAAGGKALASAAQDGDKFGRVLELQQTHATQLGAGVAIVGRELLTMGERGRIALTQVGTGLTITGLAIASVLGLAIAKNAEYEASVSRSIAVTGAYGEELESVRRLTLELGASTVFTATEAAEGVTELGKAGVSTANILSGALSGSLSLAAAGEIAVADAAAITASTLNQFKLRGTEAGHVSDLLAAAAGKAQGSVGDLGAALKQSGLVAAQMGLSVEESTGTLASFAAAGLIGSDAGTSFRTMLLSLANPSKEAQAALKSINVEAYDARGNFVGIAALSGQLKAGLAGATQATRDQTLATIFGSDAIRAANVLYNEGEAGIRDWTEAVDEAGYAAKVAGINQDNLRGDVEKLGGAFDTALIKIGGGANGVLRELVQSVADLVTGFSQLPDWLQQVILGGAALTAGVLLFAGATTVGIAKLIEFRANLAILRAEMPLTTGALSRVSSFLAGPWGVALLAAGLGVKLFTDYLDSLKATTNDYQNAILNAASAEELFALADKGRPVSYLKEATKDAETFTGLLNTISTSDFLTGLDLKAQQLQESLRTIGVELGKTAGTNLPEAQNAFRELASTYDLNDEAQQQLLDSMPAYREALVAQATALGINVTSSDEAANSARLLELAQGDNERATNDAADAYKDAADATAELESNLTDLLEVLNKANGVNQDAISANIQYRDTLATVDAAIAAARSGQDGYALTLDTTTQAGRDNMNMLVDLATNAWDAAEAQLAVDHNTQNFQSTLEASRADLIARAEALGYNAEQATALADSILKIPSKAEVQILVDTAAATTKIGNWVTTISGLRVNLGVDVNGKPVNRGQFAQGGIVEAYASGGVRENHVPQIAAAGAMRVWAEPETGGEAYIPFAMDRRARAEGLLAEVASRFGGAYVPAGGTRHAAGSITDGGAAATLDGVRITGTLDLGDGLVGFVDGRIQTAATSRELDNDGGAPV